jgi:hypothetical protein
VCLYEPGAFAIKLWPAGDVSPCKSDDVSCRTQALRAQKDGFWGKNIWAGLGSLILENTASTAPATIMGMPGCGLFSRFPEIYDLFIGNRFFEDVLGRIPIAIFHFTEIPGVTFPTGEITPGLINGEIVFRPGKMNRGNEPIPFPIFSFQGSLARQCMFPIYLDPAAART